MREGWKENERGGKTEKDKAREIEQKVREKQKQIEIFPKNVKNLLKII